jgi:hypothetical protein
MQKDSSHCEVLCTFSGVQAVRSPCLPEISKCDFGSCLGKLNGRVYILLWHLCRRSCASRTCMSAPNLLAHTPPAQPKYDW